VNFTKNDLKPLENTEQQGARSKAFYKTGTKMASGWPLVSTSGALGPAR